MVNGQYLQLHTTENHDEVQLLDLMSGSISSFETFGYGYEVFPKTDAIMFYDINGTPYVQKPDADAMPIQLGHAEPYVDKTAMISLLAHEDDGGISLNLFSLEDHEWLMFKINTKAN